MAVNFYTPKYFALNNWSAHAIEFDAKLYPTSEHAYHAAKVTDDQAKEEIRLARSPKKAKVLANEKFRAIRDPKWDTSDFGIGIMEQILRAKLAQHDEVRDALIQSGQEEIVEDSPTDYFWGEGANGTGQNHLGKLWMKLRSELPADI